MKRLSLFIMAFFVISQLSAQTYQDAYRISQYGVFGTASYMGRAGAIGALGGDFTAASYNPAGLGIYYRSDVFMSTSLHIGNTGANYNGAHNSDFRTSFYWLPIGLVLAAPTDNQYGWKALQFSIGASRLTPFNRATTMQGYANSSLTDAWCNEMNSYGSNPPYNPYTYDLAFATGLIIDTMGGFVSAIPGNNILQKKYVTEYGGVDELTVSFSANYNDFLYLGATIGVPFADYEMYSEYTESTPNPGFNYTTSQFTYYENLATSGVGVNLKLGAIIKPINWLRVGLAFHTPTFYSLHDTYSTSLYDAVASQWENSPYSEYDYYLTTPYRILASLGTTFGNQDSKIGGSLGIDYEYSDYKFMQYSGGNDVDWKNGENNLINDIYKAGHTFRIGGSLNVEQVVFRLGYALWTTPYKTDIRDYDKNTFTAGIGYKSKFWYIDFAYAYSQQKSDYVIYPYNPMPVANLTKNENLFVCTLGWRF